MIGTVAVENYRSLRHLVLPLGRLTVVTGANGSGKSSLYRSMRLLADAAREGLVAALAREGGLRSTLWAGPENVHRGARGSDRAVSASRRIEPVNLRLGYAADDFGYAVDLGIPVKLVTAFSHDPEFKREAIWAGPVYRPSATLAERAGPVAWTRDQAGRRRQAPAEIRMFDSMLAELADPFTAPEVIVVREQLRSWRFYDQLRTDSDAPARTPQIGVRTPILAGDGSDLAAALQTIAEIGDAEALTETVADAFPGSRLHIGAGEQFEVAVAQPGLLRPLRATELSDGTLRFLLLAAALLTPRPPALMVLNEPETSLHPDLLGPLGRLMAAACRHTQLVVVTHSAGLLAALRSAAEPTEIELYKEHGQTLIRGQRPVDEPSWHWPPR